MPRISRRALLATSASTLVGTVAVGASSSAEQAPSPVLLNLIGTHQSTYDLFCHAMHESDHDAGEIAKLGRDEETALLAVCSFRASSEHDRRAKAEYLLEIERRGELDLREQMQALLRSML